MSGAQTVKRSPGPFSLSCVGSQRSAVTSSIVNAVALAIFSFTRLAYFLQSMSPLILAGPRSPSCQAACARSVGHPHRNHANCVTSLWFGILPAYRAECPQRWHGSMKKWSEDQLQASVDAYLALRGRLANGQKINKSQAYRDLAQQHGRDQAAWARRFSNISQVMTDLGYQPIAGLKPLPNVGTNVTKQLAAMIHSRLHDTDEGMADDMVRFELSESDTKHQGDGFLPDLVDDQRLRSTRSIAMRRGQRSFRRKLIEIYRGRCAITDCGVPDVLEAAHIFPYLSGPTNNVGNGLLLRSDIHTLFDLYLVSADPETLVVSTSPKLGESEYGALSGKSLAERATGHQAINRNCLEWHRSRCKW